jgi:hypothetical protein
VFRVQELVEVVELCSGEGDGKERGSVKCYAHAREFGCGTWWSVECYTSAGSMVLGGSVGFKTRAWEFMALMRKLVER